MPSLELVAAVLRLSKKYDCPLFREDCVHRLKAEFPSTLAEFDDINGWSFIKEDSRMLFPVLSLAAEIDLHSVLPLIYYLIVSDYYDDMRKVRHTFLYTEIP